jgi:isopropylmalate/homocitrate/citramalate synthase
MNYPERVKLVEVGPRDGLQNEAAMIPTAIKVELIDRLADAGVQTIETTSFVSPKWIPQLADAAEVYQSIHRRPGTAYTVLVPNVTGLKRALKVGVEEIAVFTGGLRDLQTRKNINVSIEESIERFVPVLELAKSEGLRVRGYVSCALGCPTRVPSHRRRSPASHASSRSSAATRSPSATRSASARRSRRSAW